MYLKKELFGLIRSDERIFDFIQDSSLDGLWYWDLENPENEWMNAKFWTVLGYNPDEMPHKSSAWQSIINQDDLKIAYANLKKHCENPDHPYDQLVRYTHKNGSTKWIRCRGLAIRDAEGKAIRMLGAHQDVTDIKNKEQELLVAIEIASESEEKYRALYNNAPLSYQSLDENGCFIDINPKWLQTLGYERDEVIGKWYGDFLHPDYIEHFQINFPAFKKRGYVSDVQFKLRKKDNTYIDVSFEGRIGYTPEGKFKQTYSVFKDITKQKSLEDALLEAKEKAEESVAKLNALFTTMSEMVVLHELVFDENGKPVNYRITDCNDAFTRITGITKNDSVGRLSTEVFGTEHPPYLKEYSEVALKGEPQHYESYFQPMDKYFSISVISPGKNHFATVTTDVTEHKRAEIVLQERNEVIAAQNEEMAVQNEELNQTNQELIAAKENAEESENRYRGLISNINAGVVVHAADTTVIMSNTRANQLLGLSEEQIKGKAAIDPHWKFIDEDNIPIPLDNYPVMRIVKSKEPINNQMIGVCRSSDDVVWLMVNGFPVFDDKQEIIEVVISFIDITERKIAEEKLKESELKYRSLIESSSDAIFCVDENGEYKFTNHLFASTFGKTPEYFIGKTFWDVYDKEHADFRYEATKRLFRTGKSETLEVEVPLPEKTLFYLATTNPIKDESGQVLLNLTHATDITELKLIERMLQEKSEEIAAQNEEMISQNEELYQTNLELTAAKEKAEKSERKLKSILENLQDAFFQADLKGNFTYVNSIAARMYGYSENELLGLPASKLYANSSERDKLIEVLRKEGKVFDWTGKGLRKDGSSFWVSMNVKFIIDNQGNITGTEGIVRDITERKNAEAELIIAKERAIESEERFQLAMKASHDGLFDWNLETNDIYYSVGWKEMLGYQDHEFPNDFSEWEKTTDPKEFDKIRELLLQLLLKKADRFVTEIKMKHKDGHWVDILSRAEAIFNESGKAIRIVGTHTDISDRKEAEQALKESELKFRALFEKGPIGVAYHRMIYDAAGKPVDYFFLDANESYQELTGVDPIGKLVTEAFPGIENDPSDWIGVFGKVARFGETIRFESYLESNQRWYDCVAYQYKPDHFVAAFLEITKRKHAELKLKEINENLTLKNSEIEFNNERLESLLEISQYSSNSIQELLDFALEEAILLTKSKIGYIYFYHEDTKQFILNTWSKEVMHECQVMNPENVYDLDKTGCWGEAVRQRKPIILNEYQEESELKKGTPEGHVQLKKFLTIPVIIDNVIVAVCGVANKDTDYDNSDVRQLTLLMDSVWKISERITLIKELTTAKEKAEESQLHFETVFAKSPVSIMIHDLDTGEIINANTTAYTSYGLDSLEALQQNDFWMEPPYSLEDSIEMIQKAAREEIQAFEWKSRKVTGEIFWELVTLRPLVIDGKERMLSTAVDITDQKQKEIKEEVLFQIAKASFVSENTEELVESIKILLNKLIDTTNFYIAFYDKESDMLSTPFEADEEDQIETWRANKSVTGLVIKTGKTLLLKKPDLLELIKSGEIDQVGTLSEVWLGVPLFSGSDIIGVLAVQDYRNPDAYDAGSKEILKFVSSQISMGVQRKKFIQDLLTAKEKAEESDRLKSAFLANMSHEIRTPMNGIMGFAELLTEPDLTGAEQQKCIDMIGKSGKRMLNIINDIIDISKLEAGLMKPDLNEAKINEQTEFIYSFFKPEVEAKGIRFSFNNTLPSQKAIIRTDREKLYAILTNLVKNAIKYTKEGSIEFGYHLKRDNEAVELEFYVKDTGIGIPKDRQDAIFERFIQADIADKMAYQGAGLGLAITKAYVEMLGGRIWVESNEGSGSIFYFTLPYSTITAVVKNTDRELLHSGSNETARKLKILVAEDDEVSEMVIDSYIKMYSKDVLKARTGLEAVDACLNHPDIDLILMDIRMPEMNGYEATQQIRQFNKEVVIIAQTAYGLAGDRQKSIESGCNDYITKPISKADLKAMINKYFGN
ncbi:MAG: PAS/PAC sensor hybrid histidine kinase [Bacteroidetes bacterium]|nr:MAG: PAS/PAC sensor hybrid histidine kinase [Bacteroidota bacterium]